MQLTTNDVAQALKSDENANWSWQGSLALAEWFEEMEDEDNEQDLDVVAIRCEFSEFESLQNWISEYYGKDFAESMKLAGIDLEDDDDDEEHDRLIRSHIQDHGTLIEFSGGIIVSSF